MRISIVTPFYPPDHGGIATHVQKLTKQLAKKNKIQIITCTPGKAQNLPGNPQIVKIPSVIPPPVPYQTLTSFRIPKTIIPAINAIKAFNPDIIHLHGHHYPINWITAKHLKETPKILTMHGMYALNPNVQGGKTLTEEIFNQTIFKWFLNKLNAIIALTPTIANYARKYTQKPIYIIPNGIDTEKYLKNIHRKTEYREKYDLPQDKTIVLFRGRFTHVKGVLEFTATAKTLSRKRSDLYFLAVGGGPLEKAVRKRLQTIENAKTLPWTPLELIHELYIASDIYVLPSKWEALPITVLEAMAANLAIVATKVGGVPDILTPYHKKVLIEKANPNEIAQGIEKATKLVHEEKFSQPPAEYIRQYDWSQISIRIQETYHNIL